MVEETVVHGTCPHDCYDTCSLRVHAAGGRVTRIEGDPDHPLTRGFLCLKVNRYLERLHHPERLLHPLRRRGLKGRGDFVEISWSEAMSEVGERLRAILARYGGEAVLPYSFYGNMGLLASGALDERLWRRIGASNLERTICTASGNAALRWVFGQAIGPDPELMPGARCVVLWGHNPMVTNLHEVPLLDRCRRQGGAVVTIDPLRTETAARYDRHLALRPGSDLPLALGLGRALLAGPLDLAFARERAEGLAAYRRIVEPWTIERTAEATGLDPAAIAELAERLRTARPLLLRPGYGVQRQARSFAAVWAIAALSILTGAWLDPGGGLLLSAGGAFPLRHLGGPPRPTRTVNMVEIGRALTKLRQPPVMALVVYQANPAATAPDQAAVLRGLGREDLFTVVHEQFLTDTARYADIVLPAAMGMEVLDLHTSYWHRYVQLSRPAAPPPGEAVSNPESFRRLASALGLEAADLYEDDEGLIRHALATGHPWLEGITFDVLWRDPVQKLRLPAGARPFVDTPVPLPGGKLRLAPPPAVRAEVWQDAPPLEAGEFHLLTPSRRETIKSSFGNVESLRRGRPRPELLIAPADMAALGLAPGQAVRVTSAQGDLTLAALPSDVAQRGVVVSYAVRWNEESGGRNVNRLTSAALADHGGGATFYSLRVRVEPLGE